MKKSLLIILLAIHNLGFAQLHVIQQLVDAGKFEQAIELADRLEKTLYCEKNDILGYSYYQLHNYAKAIEHYQKYLTCNNSFTAHINIGDSFFKIGIGDSAYSHFITAYNIDPTNNIVNYNLGMINYTSSYDSDAIYHFKKAISHSEGIDFDSYEMITEVYNQSGEYDSAEMIAKALVELAKKENADTIRSQLILAYTYGDMGRTDKLIDILTSLINNGISNKEQLQMAYYNRYLGYYLLDDKDKACKDYLKLQSLKVPFEVERHFHCEEAK